MGCRGSILAAASPGASLDSDVPSNQRMREGFRSAHYNESNGRNSARFAAGGDNSCFRGPSAVRASLTDAGIMHLCNMLRNEEMIAVCEAPTISVLVDTMEELRGSGQKDAILLSVLRTLLLLCRSWPGNAQGAEPRLVDELLSVMGSEEWNTEEARKLALSALAALMERFDMSQDIARSEGGIKTLLAFAKNSGEDSTKVSAIKCLVDSHDTSHADSRSTHASVAATERDVSTISRRVAQRITAPPSASLASCPDIPNGHKFHCFLSYNWGSDEEGRENHDRVSCLNELLKRQGISTWFDKDRLLGNNLVDQMARGIDSSLCVIVCVTKQYIDKVGGLNGADNCKKEFTYAEQRKSSALMLPVVMERGMLNQRLWHGSVGMTLGGHFFHDLSNDSLFDEMAEGIVDEIKSMCLAACTSTAASSLCSTKMLHDSTTSMDGSGIKDEVAHLLSPTIAQSLPAQNPPTSQAMLDPSHARLEPLAEIDF